METTKKATSGGPKDRGLNSDEQKRRTNRPKQSFPDGTDKNRVSESEHESEKEQRSSEQSKQ